MKSLSILPGVDYHPNFLTTGLAGSVLVEGTRYRWLRRPARWGRRTAA